MKRWNGWGKEATIYPLGESAITYLRERLGDGTTIPDASLEDVIAAVPQTRLPEHPWLIIDPAVRLQHSRGQSLPDWIALRSGRIDCFTDGVVYPSSNYEVRDLFEKAKAWGAVIIPYGGGTSVVGHVNPLPGDRPVVTLDMQQFNGLLDLDEESLLARIGAGITGPELERELAEHGYLLGHFPQSFEYSTLGGWVATRSSGQQSYYYGRIEELVAGAHLEMPSGSLDIPPTPASAAGPDLRHVVLGSEGRLGIITDVVVRIRPLPQVESFYGAFFRDWNSGLKAVKYLAQAKVPVSMIRLSDPVETETTLALAGRERVMTWADRGLRLLRYGPGRCLMMFGITGESEFSSAVLRRTISVIRRNGGLYTGRTIGSTWQKGRFLTPYLRNTLWDLGYAIDTLETAMPWSRVNRTRSAIIEALSSPEEKDGQKVLVFSHISHVYGDGASIYITFLFPRSVDPDETLESWRYMKREASEAIVDHQGTISHQHGVGLDHLPYMAKEKGLVGLEMLKRIQRYANPDQIMNPGKLLPDDSENIIVT